MMHKAQAMLEFTLFFIVIAALSLGLIGLWKVASDNIVQRQINYNAARVASGSTPSGSFAPSNIPLGFTYNVIDPYLLNHLSGGSANSYSLLSLEQINNNLDDINQAIADTQANMVEMTRMRDSWRSLFNEAQAQEASAQQQTAALQAQRDAKQRELDEMIRNNQCGGEDDPCARLISEINNLEPLSMSTNGYYTIEYSCGEGDTCTEYDYSNAQWMAKFGTREKWAEDYMLYRQYGASPGNNQYGLYTNYTPGLLDWQSRKAYAQSKMDYMQSNLDETEKTLAKLTAMRDGLLDAQAGKTLP